MVEPIPLSPEIILNIKLIIYPMVFIFVMVLTQRGTKVLGSLIKKMDEFLQEFNKISLFLLIVYLLCFLYIRFG